MSFQRTIRGGMWLYIGALLHSFLAYLFWLIASVFVQPSVIGSAAAILALQSVLIVIITLGLPTGLRRYVGISVGQSNYAQLSSYFFSGLVFFIILYMPIAIGIFLASYLGLSIFNLSSLELFFVAILLLLSFWPPLFTSLFESILRTEVTAIAKILSQLIKLGVGIFLLFLGFGFFAVIFSFVIASIIADAILLIYARKLYKKCGLIFSIQKSHLGDLIRGGLPSWIPTIVAILPQSLGVLIIFGIVGQTDTGLYYIAFAIAAIVYSVSTVVQSLMLPVLSSLKEDKELVMSRAIRLSLAVTVPLGLILALYSFLPLSLLGPSYLPGSNILTILVLGAAIAPISQGYISYIYAIGKYTHVAIIGLASTMSRLILYIILIVPFGAFGIALSYAIGELVALAVMFPSAYRVGYRPTWLSYLKTIIIPGLLVTILFILNIHWLIGIPIILFTSMIAYARLGIIKKIDLRDLAQAILSKETMARAYGFGRPLLKIMYGE